MMMNKRGAIEQSESGLPGWLWTIIVLALIVGGGVLLLNANKDKSDIVTGGVQTVGKHVEACNIACGIGIGGKYAYCTEPRTIVFSDGLKSDPTTCYKLLTTKAIVHPAKDTSEEREVGSIESTCSSMCAPSA